MCSALCLWVKSEVCVVVSHTHTLSLSLTHTHTCTFLHCFNATEMHDTKTTSLTSKQLRTRIFWQKKKKVKTKPFLYWQVNTTMNDQMDHKSFHRSLIFEHRHAKKKKKKKGGEGQMGGWNTGHSLPLDFWTFTNKNKGDGGEGGGHKYQSHSLPLHTRTITAQ